MATRVHANNFTTTTTTSSLTAIATTVAITSSTGLPTISGGDFYYLTLALGNIVEIVKVTSRSSLTLTIVRGQEGTSGLIWPSGSQISLNATANSIDRKADAAASSTDTAFARFSGTGGNILQNSVVTCDGSGNLASLGTINGSTIPGGSGTLLTTASSTGSGDAVLATSPTLVTPLLGTPTSGNLANCTGYPTSGLDGNFNVDLIIHSTINAGLGGATSGTNKSTNTAFGVGSLINTTTSGTGNVLAMGYQAGIAITTGEFGTVLGSQAGKALTTGTNSTFVGYNAGLKITTSSSNTAIGSNALGSSSATASADNVCVGYNAGFGTGSSNFANCVLIGSGAGSGSSGLSQGVGIGYTALQVASGANNCALGYNSGPIISTGTDNALFGWKTCEIATSCSKMTVMGSNGFSSMGNAGSNNNNTGFGYAVGKSGATGAASITTGSGNTFLGARASGSDATCANSIAIGQDAVSTLATGATSGTFGPGISFGSAAFPVGFRGDGTIIPCTTGANGFWKTKINGTFYYVPLVTDGASTMPSAGGTGITMNTASGTTQTAAVNNGYICTNASQCNVTLPATAAVGDIVKVMSQGAGGIKVTANTSQTVKGLGDTTTSAGSVTPAAQYDTITVICVVANTTWVIDTFTSSLLTFA